MTSVSAQPLVSIHDLRVHFPLGSNFPWGKSRYVHAVDGVDLSIWSGQTLGLVGESGCGKTTIGRSVTRLIQPTQGVIEFEGYDVTRLSGREMRRFRHNVQMVFQDPYTSLNPRLSVGAIIAEPLRINQWGTKISIQKRTDELLDAVGLSREHAHRLPHEFSGGQRQRIAIARALALEPKLVVCDEPVSALDMSIQAKILNLLSDLQSRLQLTYLFISHDLSVVRLVSDWVAVMYLGKIVEIGSAEVLFFKPLHPYTQALMSAVPNPHARSGIFVLPGEIPSNINPIRGCRFHARCAKRMSVCGRASPALRNVGEERSTACFLYHEEEE